MMVRVRFANKTRKRNREKERERERREEGEGGENWNEKEMDGTRHERSLSSAIRLVECYFRRTERILSVLLGEWLINTAEVIERGEGECTEELCSQGTAKMTMGAFWITTGWPQCSPKVAKRCALASSRCTFARLMSLNWLTWIINPNYPFFFFSFFNY